MLLSAKIREQVISSFRAELAEHVQTITQGLLALEQDKVSGSGREETITTIFRAAHSLKGAARAVSVTAIEQLAHALEDVLGGIQRGEFQLTTGLFTACYQALDAIQAVQAAYEAGKTVPPQQALEALVNLDLISKEPAPVLPKLVSHAPVEQAVPPPARPLPKQKTPDRNMKEGLENLTEALVHSYQESLGFDLPRQNPDIDAVVQPPDGSPPAAAPKVVVDETIRVSIQKLDSLMAQLSELLISKIHADQLLSQLKDACEFINLWQKEWLMTRNSYTWLERQDVNGAGRLPSSAHFSKELAKVLTYVDFTQGGLRELIVHLNSLMQQHQSDVMQLSMVIDRLEDEIKRVRMLPFSTITESFGRMVRDLAEAAGKKASLEIRGGQVELDKGVLEKIKDPIVHLLRNAVDHGIELPDQRVAAGKPPQGKITLSVEAIGREILISVSDDGAGLDLKAIRQAAIRRGLEHTQEMTPSELSQLIYLTGFTTNPIITDVSGRGIGLDIVRRNCEILHGKVNVDWELGRGTKFTLVLPLTLTSSRALIVRAADQWFAIPLNTIERIQYLKQEEITVIGTSDTILFEGQQVMLVPLCRVLGLPYAQKEVEDGSLPIVILSAAGRRMAFIVDELGDEQEVVVKPLGKQIIYLGGIAGAHLMGNGDVLLVVNVSDLIKLALRGDQVSCLSPATAGAGPSAQKATRQRILVVDDSITTRTLEKNILEAAGYSVQLAVNGMEAFNTLRVGDLPDLVITDVAMPSLDGFGLTKSIRGDSRLAKIPVILVTSLDSPEDKARGIDCGADAYIVKSSFDQANLLETIQQLI